MSKVTKAIKYFHNLTDEEKQEFIDVFSKEEDVEVQEEKQETPETKVEKTEEVKKEEIKEEKEIDKDERIDKLIESLGLLSKEFKEFKETAKKTTSFGAKPKVTTKEGTQSFDDVFSSLKR